MNKYLIGCLSMLASGLAQAQTGVVLTGVEAGRDTRYAYLGAVLPVKGYALGNGWVQRYWLDYLDYRYQSASSEIDAGLVSGEAAIGYQGSSASDWWGVYLGVRYQNIRLNPDDLTNDSKGGHFGAKLLAESDMGVGTTWRANGAIALTSQSNWWTRVRIYTPLGKSLHIGPEVTAQGDPSYRLYKLGVFLGGIPLRGDSFLTLKAGLTKQDTESTTGYLGAEFYIPFK